ncbi:hypothetical protein PMZ80_006332 [Knufia obscura]|uniref:Cupin type-1 domain-containing protein n=2 Tax=Knufia TaxID=430999 RepID=A0AAN8I5U3_9EURO|nr:hypothetical protein PMZ80_006332 [Knufia obscura]KAK5953524.1 hypothetical protein OHC33_005468 [Knufia fluminis]
MQLLKTSALALLTLSELIDARPSPYWTKQHLINDPQAAVKVHNPYSPEYRDKYDHKIDAEGEGLDPLPYRNGMGTSVLGPWNKARSRQDPDLVRPPSTDSGVMKNMRWSFADSHIRMGEASWTRQTTLRELPSSLEIAGVNMRLDAGVIRELHWHVQAEWAYVLEGNVRITALDQEGGNFVGDLEKGDLWYFPRGHPHSLQGLGPNGTEFLLIFDDGQFSEDSTFLLTDWLAHTPKSVLAENFRLAPEVFDAIPKSEKYMFQGSIPKSIDEEQPKEGHGIKKSKLQFTHKLLAQEPLNTTGGQVRIADSKTTFPLSKTIAAAHLTLHPGSMREMHWHPQADEWSFFIKGRARVTIFASEGTARTFDYGPGDVGVVPKNNGHFIENLSDDEEVEVLEIFRSDEFLDFSLFDWMASTPRRMVAEHLFQGDKERQTKFLGALEKGIDEVGAHDPIRAVPDDHYEGDETYEEEL